MEKAIFNLIVFIFSFSTAFTGVLAGKFKYKQFLTFPN